MSEILRPAVGLRITDTPCVPYQPGERRGDVYRVVPAEQEDSSRPWDLAVGDTGWFMAEQESGYFRGQQMWFNVADFPAYLTWEHHA